MSVIMLDEMKHLFRDEDASRKFIATFREAMKGDRMPLVLVGNEVLCTVISPETTQDLLCKRIIERIMKKPKLIEDIEEGLHDEIVE